MNFKYPEIFYFLLLLLLPILVHLFQLRRFKTEYFTNVKFLKELSLQTRKSSKIKKYLLLATRLLLLFCLIFAFAQPFFKSKVSKNTSNELFVVLDNSFSMQAKGKKGELLKRAVQDLLENVPENQQFSLVTNTENYWNTDIKSIQNELQNLQYSASPFVFDNLMAKINAHKSVFNKDIIVITDAIDLKESQLKSIDKNDNVYFILPKSVQENNVSIDSVFINQNSEEFYEIGIKLKLFGDKKSNFPVALYNFDKLIAKTVLSFDENDKTINFSLPKQDFHGYVSIDDNSLSYDNKLYFSLSKPQKISVIAIGELQKSDFLSRIYTNDEFVFQNFELAALDYNLLEKQDAIILNELINIPQALQTTLNDFVSKGGNLIFIPSATCSLENTNDFLKKFGNLKFNTIENTDKLVTKIHFSNPLFSTVFEKEIDNFQYPSTKISYSTTGNFAPILSYANQNSFLLSIPQPISSIFVFTSPINKIDSNFQNSPLIVPIFYKMSQNAVKTGVNAMIIGQNNPFLVDVLLKKDEILSVKKSKNLKENFIPIQQILNNKVKLSFGDNPQLAGNYEIYNRNTALKNISFNYNRIESNMTQTNENLLSDYKIVSHISTILDKINTDRTDSQIWKIFIIFALMFLIAEIFIQKFIK